MSREIKYRGRRVDNGEWVYGSYHRAVGEASLHEHVYTGGFKKVAVILNVHWILQQVLPQDMGWDINSTYRPFKVSPETVGEYIGLKDKNGIDIYRGDILKHNQNIYIVWWTENMGICLIHKKHFSPDKKSVLTTDNRQDFNFIWSTQKYIEVIGNIYQNPELIPIPAGSN